MSREILRDRERALEYEFFHKVDVKLMGQLKEKLAKQELAKSLGATTGITDQEVLEELVSLGFRDETILALGLYPLVCVAWADGSVADKERAAILRAAVDTGHGKDSLTYHLLEAWLDHEPGSEFETAWTDYVGALAATISAPAITALKNNLLLRSRAVAESAGGFLGIHKVAASEEAVLKKLENIFDNAISGKAE